MVGSLQQGKYYLQKKVVNPEDFASFTPKEFIARVSSKNTDIPIFIFY